MEANLVILLVKLVVAASFASILARSARFQNLLLSEDRGVLERVWLSLGISGFCAAGATARILARYMATDLSLEGSLVAGMLGGYVPGLLSGVLISIPAMAHHEYLSMPLYAAAGVMGGLLRDLAESPDDIWRFSPFPEFSLWRMIRHKALRRRSLYHVVIVLTIGAAELLRQTVLKLFGEKNIFALYAGWKDPHPLLMVAVYATTIFSVSIPIKIWNSARNERLLEMKERLLAQARLSALSSQINPHFLFNTLNTVSSLIRTKPDEARRVVYRLSHILRRLLRKTETFAPLKEELSFIEDYVSIEVARFGEKLRFVKDIDPQTLEWQVPSMALQPIVENSIKHGLSQKLGGGEIRIESRISEDRLVLRISDDGVGMDEGRLGSLLELGIGMSNVNERLKVLFGSNYRLRIDSRPGEGTMTEIELPAPVGVS
jgi:two-component system, LytTR family, sensor kinase